MAVDLSGVKKSSWVYRTPTTPRNDEDVPDGTWREFKLPDFHHKVTVKAITDLRFAYPEGDLPDSPAIFTDGAAVDPDLRGVADLDAGEWHEFKRRDKPGGGRLVTSFFVAGNGSAATVQVILEDGP